MTFRGRNPALLLQFTPRHIVFLGSDQTKDICFTPIFTYQGCCQPQTPACLNLGCDAENWRGQQVDLVVDNESPVITGEEREVREVFLLGIFSVLSSSAPIGEDLIGADGNRSDVFPFFRVFSDPLGCNIRFVDPRIARPPVARYLASVTPLRSRRS